MCMCLITLRQFQSSYFCDPVPERQPAETREIGEILDEAVNDLPPERRTGARPGAVAAKYTLDLA
jgi:hypothetical protein